MKQSEPKWFTHLLAYGGLMLILFVTYELSEIVYFAYVTYAVLGVSDETKMVAVVLTAVYAVAVPNIIWAARKIYESESDDGMSGPLDDTL